MQRAQLTAGLSQLVVAMDGTAGAGKSTASRGVAARLGLRYLDTGAMYRAVTWAMLLDDVDLGDASAVASRAESVSLESGTDPERPTVTLDGTSVEAEIRFAETTAAVSQVSAVPSVRAILRDQQRQIIGAGGIVVEGRDIGTVVAPEAALKVYLTADASARAVRRSAELSGATRRDVKAVETDLLRRDEYDSTRVTSPLAAAPDAVMVDSTFLTLDQVIEQIVTLALERCG
ncbi:MAG: (d)CMP kinase [Nocardioidaceae bacterium]